MTHESVELVGEQGLATIDESLMWIRVNIDQDAVGAGRHCGEGQG